MYSRTGLSVLVCTRVWIFSCTLSRETVRASTSRERTAGTKFSMDLARVEVHVNRIDIAHHSSQTLRSLVPAAPACRPSAEYLKRQMCCKNCFYKRYSYTRVIYGHNCRVSSRATGTVCLNRRRDSWTWAGIVSQAWRLCWSAGSVTARAANRRFGLLSTLCARTKPP